MSMINKKGFTLVEVLLVIVIIGIIGVITIPNIMEALNSSRKESGKAIEDLLKDNLEMYNEDNMLSGYKYNTVNGITINSRENDLFNSFTNSIDSCYIYVSYEDLKRINPDINMGECLFNPLPDNALDNDLMIERNVKLTNKNIYVVSYKYYADIICGKGLKSNDNINSSDVYYRTTSKPTTSLCS